MREITIFFFWVKRIDIINQRAKSPAKVGQSLEQYILSTSANKRRTTEEGGGGMQNVKKHPLELIPI